MAVWAYAALAGLQVLNGLNQASLIRQQAQIDKQMADLNVQLAEIDKFDSLAEGMTQEARYDQVIQSIAGQQETILAAKDIDSDFGTARQMQEASGLNGMLNKLDISNAAYAKAMGYDREISAINLNSFMRQQQASLNATATVQTSLIQAAGTGISGYMKSMSGSNVESTIPSDTNGTTVSEPRLGYLGFQGRY